ncbi:MAG TPA: PAS domain-containing protein, partial [Enterovirga sp.]
MGVDSVSSEVFVGDSEMAALMRKHDWAATPLGPPEAWPQALKVALQLLLTSRFEMWLGWGRDVHFFYNDAYRPTLGTKHPRSLGMPTRELWKEIWDDVEPRISAVYEKGEATWDRALLLLLHRNGYPEETYHTFSYSPLRGDTGKVEGLFCAVSEETERVISERRLGSLRELAAGLTLADTRAGVLAALEERLGKNLNDLPFTLTYLFENGVARLVAATGMPRGHAAAPEVLDFDHQDLWPAARILRGEREITLDLEGRHAGLPTGAWMTPPLAALLVPFSGPGTEAPTGFLVAGLNPHRRNDADYPSFVRLIAGQIGAGLANAEGYEAERRRAVELSQAVRLREQAANVLQAANATLTAEVQQR